MFWPHCLSLFFGTLIYLTELFDSSFASAGIRVLHRWFILLFLCLRLTAPHLLNGYIQIHASLILLCFKAEFCLFWEILLPKTAETEHLSCLSVDLNVCWNLLPTAALWLAEIIASLNCVFDWLMLSGSIEWLIRSGIDWSGVELISDGGGLLQLISNSRRKKGVDLNLKHLIDRWLKVSSPDNTWCFFSYLSIFPSLHWSDRLEFTLRTCVCVRVCALARVSASSSSFEVPPHDVTAAPERPALEAALCFFFSPPASFYFEIPFDTQAARARLCVCARDFKIKPLITAN